MSRKRCGSRLAAYSGDCFGPVACILKPPAGTFSCVLSGRHLTQQQASHAFVFPSVWEQSAPAVLTTRLLEARTATAVSARKFFDGSLLWSGSDYCGDPLQLPLSEALLPHAATWRHIASSHLMSRRVPLAAEFHVVLPCDASNSPLALWGFQRAFMWKSAASKSPSTASRKVRFTESRRRAALQFAGGPELSSQLGESQSEGVHMFRCLASRPLATLPTMLPFNILPRVFAVRVPLGNLCP